MSAVVDRSAQAPARRVPWLSLAAPALIPLTLITQFLASHGYDLLQPESLILLCAAAAVGLGLGMIARLRPGTLEPLVIAFLLITFVIKQPELMHQLGAAARPILPASGIDSVLGLLLALAFGIFMLCWFLRRHLTAIVATVFGAMFLATILLPHGAGSEPVRTGALPKVANDLPPVIHIILDEHIGLAGLPPEVEGSSKAADVLRTTYRDFALYSRAYSRFAQTEYALTSLMNGTPGSNLKNILTRPNDSHAYRLERNEWFRQLRDEGYAISVYQSSYLDFCRDADACYTYPNSLSSLQQLSLTSVQQRIRIIFGLFMHPRRGMYPLGAMGALHRFTTDVEQRPQGTAFILHLILPHTEYIFREDCSVADPRDWGGSGNHRTEVMNTPDERIGRYALYLAQVGCLSKQMNALFAELTRLELYEESTIIVHGDHGSRIGENPWYGIIAGDFSNRNLLDHFSTLLAVKMPKIKPRVDTTPVAIQNYFVERFLGIAPPLDLPNTVLIREADTEFIPRELRWPDPSSTTSKPLTPRP